MTDPIRRSQWRRRLLPGWLWAVAALLLAACGGGGGGSPTNPQPPPNQRQIVYTSGGGGANSVTLVQTSASGSTTLTLDLMANQINGLYGVAFDLMFPAANLSFVSAAEGSHLSGAGGQVDTSLQVSQSGGTLIVGLSRLGNVDGVDGSGVLLTLTFTATGTGSGQLAFDRSQAADSQGGALGGVAFVGGQLRVQL